MKLLVTLMLIGTSLSSYAETKSFIKEFSGKLRSHHNYRQYEVSNAMHGEFASALMVGGELSILTNTYYGLSGKATLASSDYVINNPRDKDGLYQFLFGEENIAVRSESYLTYTRNKLKIESGRKKINTPFANGSDAFIIPITYEGLFSQYKMEHLNLQLMRINKIKARNTSSFTSVADYALARLNQTTTETDYNNETTIIGFNYKNAGLKTNIWHYNYSDLFTTTYLDADYSHNKVNYAVQIGQQSDNGEALIGDIDSKLAGLKLSYKASNKLNISLGHNKVDTNEDSFKGGAWITPYTIFTDTIFTNSMLSGMGNMAPGSASKLMLLYGLTEKTDIRLSYSQLVFAEYNSVDQVTQDEVDFWITSKLPMNGLSVTNRFARLDSTNDGQSVFAWRSQLQYVF